MGIVVKQPVPDPPYSLHDAHILALELKGNTLRLVTQYGYVCTVQPWEQVDGDVEITGVDADSSYVYVMEYPDVLCGNCGRFTGRKMTLEVFLRETPRFSLDVMDETCGFRQMNLAGFLNLPGRCLEFRLELCYDGEFRYLLRE